MRQTPGPTSTICSRSPCLRHICPAPPMKYQISSIVRCVTALEIIPGASSKWAKLPPFNCRSGRTSVPSGAMSKGDAGSRRVSNSDTTPSHIEVAIRSKSPSRCLVGEPRSQRSSFCSLKHLVADGLRSRPPVGSSNHQRPLPRWCSVRLGSMTSPATNRHNNTIGKYPLQIMPPSLNALKVHLHVLWNDDL